MTSAITNLFNKKVADATYDKVINGGELALI